MDNKAVIERLMKLNNWTYEEAKQKLEGPAGKYYIQKMELREELFNNIAPGIDTLKSIEDPFGAVLKTHNKKR